MKTFAMSRSIFISIFPQLYSIVGFHSGVIKLQSQNSKVLRILIYTRLTIK